MSSPNPSRSASMQSLRPARALSSALSGSAVSSAASLATPTASAVSAMASSADSKEINIQVVVRCRPRSDKEVRENSQSVISLSGQKSKELSIRQQPNDRAAYKTYMFDRVFGPDTTQSMLYDDVVAPILDEVLMGYNCTIFAYGQTGTGKTHTMEGALDTVNGTHTADAGIVPRVLFKLFETLDIQGVEYSVKVSCIELYNEDLRDLLSSDDSKLRIYDDALRKGVVVVNSLQEVIVKSASDSIAVLQRGSHKRQIAATAYNEKSSRSHCVFMITVHIRETTPEGEELLKIGKLNLVDLAGSENIGRSGAENKRAREAGSINTSLLTLGRVINALIERSNHVPYRESKLTRLLQDSLGGRTKTCIIATISPARCNFEETMSTLDYAYRAKNIRNKPEINQKMTKKAAIKEFAQEIERLKQDLTAARDKNGVFLSDERYKELTEGCEILRAQMAQAHKDAEEKAEYAKALQETYERNMALFEQAKTTLQSTKTQLAEQTSVLRNTEQALQEQNVINQAHSQYECDLSVIIRGLVATLNTTVSDVGNLHSKIERATHIQTENKQAVHSYKDSLVHQLLSLDSALREFESIQNKIGQGLQSRMQKFATEFREYQTSTVNQMDQCTQHVTTTNQTMSSSLDDQTSASVNALHSIDAARKEWDDTQLKDEELLKNFVKDTVSGISVEVLVYCNQITGWFSNMQQRLSHVFGGVQAHVIEQSQQIGMLERTVGEYCSDMTKAAVEQHTQLEQLERRGAIEADTLKSAFMSNIEKLLDDIMTSRATATAQLIETTQQTATCGAARIQLLSQRHKEQTNALVHSNDSRLEQWQQEADNFSTITNKQSETSKAECMSLDNRVQQLQQKTTEILDSARTNAVLYNTRLASHLSEAETTVLQTAASIKLSTDAVAEHVATQMGNYKQECQRVTDGIVTDIEQWRHNTKMLTENCVNLATGFKQKTDELKEDVVQLTTKRLRDDEGTGQTPRKKQYKYPSTLVAPLDRDQVLAQYRESGAFKYTPIDPGQVFDTYIAESLQVAPPAEERNVDSLFVDEETNESDRVISNSSGGESPPRSRLPKPMVKRRLSLSRTNGVQPPPEVEMDVS